MTIVDIGIGVVIGFFLGIGAAIFYLRWKMKRQLGAMQQQMGDMMDLTSEMEGMADGLDLEGEVEEPEAEDFGSEKEEK